MRIFKICFVAAGLLRTRHRCCAQRSQTDRDNDGESIHLIHFRSFVGQISVQFQLRPMQVRV